MLDVRHDDVLTYFSISQYGLLLIFVRGQRVVWRELGISYIDRWTEAWIFLEGFLLAIIAHRQSEDLLYQGVRL